MLSRLKSAAAVLLATSLIGGQALAQPGYGPPPGYGAHPGYLHALSDLRAARWCLTHQPGDPRVFMGEDVAFNEVNAAINDIQAASINDGKNINDHPPVDVGQHGSKLLRALEFLKQARADVAQEEDNPFAQQLRRRSIAHLDRAIRAAEQAHAAWLQDVGR
jgi:hypothetical protein